MDPLGDHHYGRPVHPRSLLFQLAILPGALSPAVAAIIVRKWVTREGFSDAGLRLNRHHWRYYLAAWTLPLLVVTVIVLLATTLEISDPDFSLKRAIWQLGPPGTVAPPLPDGIFALVVFQSMIIALLATPILLGEEFGWRGYLQLRIFADRPLASRRCHRRHMVALAPSPKPARLQLSQTNRCSGCSSSPSAP